MNSKVTATEARQKFGGILSRVIGDEERITVIRRGKELAAVIPIDDLRILEAMEDRTDVQVAREGLREEGAISLDEVMAKYGVGC